MIGIVVVSHSRPLAVAALALAASMVPDARIPKVELAAGLDETTLGTDATQVAAAIERLADQDGVLVLVDLGSAVMSAEMAVEFLPAALKSTVRISPAPLIEGLVAALVTASTGAPLAEVAMEAEASVQAKVEHLNPADDTGSTVITAAPDIGDALVLEIPIRLIHGLHARPTASFVGAMRGLDVTAQASNATLGIGPVNARSLSRVTTLDLRQGHLLVTTLSGPDAAEAYVRLSELAADNFGEPTQVSVEAVPDIDQAAIATGRQIVMGPARRIRSYIDVSAYEPGDPDSEWQRLSAAVSAVIGRLRAKSAGPHGGIFTAQAVMLDDPELFATLQADTESGLSAVQAITTRLDTYASRFDALTDPYLRERAQDVRSLRRRVNAELVGAESGVGDTWGILVVDELDSVTAATLDVRQVLGIITLSGGSTSHGVIIASARGIPVLTGSPQAADIADGALIAMDPVAGRLWVEPTREEQAEVRRLAAGRDAESAAASAGAHEPALTIAGRRIDVEVNISSLQDAVTGAAQGADGSGLIRTEVLFSTLDKAPDMSTQVDSFVSIARALGGRPITVRTWDPGGDKPITYLGQSTETNPMLGERGIRGMRRLPAVFAEQLRAIALTARQTPTRVLFPMVTEPSEIVWARECLDEAMAAVGGEIDLSVGMMVETPAAALRAYDFRDLVDFVSIGTNDLTQYATAADRGNILVADYAKADSPAVIALIKMTCEAFAGKPIAVCGDMASDPALVGTLLDLGVTALSVRPPVVPIIKHAVRIATVDPELTLPGEDDPTTGLIWTPF